MNSLYKVVVTSSSDKAGRVLVRTLVAHSYEVLGVHLLNSAELTEGACTLGTRAVRGLPWKFGRSYHYFARCARKVQWTSCESHELRPSCGP